MKFKMLITYDGTPFGGWQTQKNTTAIQPLIEKALSTILREEIGIVGSGRTDAGVHAKGQVAHFETAVAFEFRRLLRSVNALLPPEIRILHIEEASDDFHARFSATGKIYHYRIHLDRTPDPFKRLFAYHVPFKLDLDLLQNATHGFLGTKDFRSFANEADEGSASIDASRTISRLEMKEEPGGFRLEFEGDGFLYKMVRNMTGTLLDIARGKISIDELPKIFEAKDRRRAGMTAPAHGLCLMQVFYPSGPSSGISSNEAKCGTVCRSGTSS